MRKFLLTIGILGIVAGVGVWIAGMAKLDWNFMELDMTKYEAKAYISEEITEIKSIKVDSINWNYKIVESEDNKVYVDYFNTDHSKTTVKLVDGELVITEDIERHFIVGMFQFLKTIDKEVVIKIPQGLAPDLNFVSVNSELDVDIDLGDIYIKNTNGNFVVDDQNFGDITANLLNGNLKLTDVTAGTLKTEMVNGTIRLTNITISSLNGDLTNGNVILDKVICPILDMKMVNGNVRGSIVGNETDYQVAYSSVSGESNLNNNSDSSRTKSIKLHTVNGDLNISFVAA